MRLAVWTTGMAASLLLTACVNPLSTDPPGPEQELAAQVRVEPTTPVVVPRALPEGYELASGTTYQSMNEQVFMASWEYIPSSSADATLPVVVLCVVREQERLPDLCVPANHEPVQTQVIDGLSVALVPIGPGADHDAEPFWSDVKLTSDWRDVPWLRG